MLSDVIHALQSIATALTNLSVRNYKGAVLTKSTTQSLANGAITAITFDGESIDTSSFHDNSTNNTRITIPESGVYLFTGNISFAANGTGARYAWIGVNAAGSNQRYGLAGGTPTPGGDTGCNTSATLKLNAGDYVQLFGYQSSGGALNVNGDSVLVGYTNFAVTKLADA